MYNSDYNTSVFTVFDQFEYREDSEYILRKQNELRLVYRQYITEMQPFYFDLLQLYLKCLALQPEYTVEDIQVFHEVIKVFRIYED